VPPWPTLDEQLLADAAATFQWRLGHPVPLAITRDGAVLFRRTPARGFASDLYELSPGRAIRTLATAAELLGSDDEQLSAAERARRERTRTATRGVVDIGVSDDGAIVLLPLGGQLHLIDRSSGTRRAIDPGGPVYDPQLSPDGSLVAFVRDGDLWIASAGGPPRRLTHRPDGFEYGVADFAAQEELRRTRGFWWSPAGDRIAFQRSDLRAVETLYVADARHNDRPPVPFRYPRAGTPNAIVDLGVVDVRAPGEPRWLTWDHARYEYLVSVQWAPRAPLSALVIDREQQDLALLAFDLAAATGPDALAGAAILTEHDDAWLNVDVGAPRWLPDGSGFLWMTEAGGDWVLERRAADGSRVAALTAPELGLRELIGLDDAGAIVEASSEPTQQDVWRVPLDGGPPIRLSSGDGVARATAARHGGVVIDTLLRAGGRRAVAITPAGARELPSAAERPRLVPTTALETVELDGRVHHVAITRPRAFDRARRYPVLLKVYGGPHAVTVEAGRDAYVMDQWYADAGFIVVRSDGRGTIGRDRSWHRAIAGDVLTLPMNDQISALKRLGAHYPELDIHRVAALGGEQGGHLATLAAMLHPDAFAAAVAVSPITDWELVDAATAERFLRTPETNPEGYRRTNASAYAEQLTRPLLLFPSVPGSRISPAHAFSLIDALSAAGKRAEIALLPDRPDAARRVASSKLVAEFFRHQLGPPTRPAVMPAARDEDEDEEKKEKKEKEKEEKEERERAQRRGSSGSAGPPRADDNDHH
jgi:dipeptidyl-peptidase-4